MNKCINFRRFLRPLIDDEKLVKQGAGIIKAPKTSYVSTLSDGKTAGYWLMVLSTPFRGRSLPFSFVIYSSRTIGAQSTSRNQEHFHCFDKVTELLGDRPLVLDREFSYEELSELLSEPQNCILTFRKKRL